MGRKAKLKQQRKSAPPTEPTPFDEDPTHFIPEMERQGYRLKQIGTSPDIPENPQNAKAQPQV